MNERDNYRQNGAQDFSKRFDAAREYWENAVKEGRVRKTSLYKEAFESEQTELYKEKADDDMIMNIARGMNTAWVGRESTGRVDTLNVNLPAAPAPTAASASGESSSTKA